MLLLVYISGHWILKVLTLVLMLLAMLALVQAVLAIDAVCRNMFLLL